MAEKKVPYQVGGRQFEGMIVYDDSGDGEAPDRVHAAGLERAFAPTRSARRAPSPARITWC